MLSPVGEPGTSYSSLLRTSLLQYIHSQRKKQLPMSQPKSLVFYLLFLSFLFRANRFVHADPYEAVFLVGPDPQPVVVDTAADGPQGSLNGNLGGTIQRPPSSNPLQEDAGNGRRKLTSKERPPGFFNNVTHSRRRNHIGQGTRSLQGTCSITNTILSINYDDNIVENGFSAIPPDPQGAVGLSRLVGVVNAMMEVRQKDGSLVYQVGFQTFFSSFPEASDFGTFLSDPKVIYDEHRGRFLVVVLQWGYSPQISRIFVAVSKGETPDTIDDWYNYYINSIITVSGNTAWVDYPGLEVDEEAVYITCDIFRFSDSNNVGVRLFVLRKGASGGFYDGDGTSALMTYIPYATAGVAATTMPAQVHGSSGVDGSVGTFLPAVIAYSNGDVQLQIYTLFNPLNSPTYILQTIDLGVITAPNLVSVDATQLGSASRIETGDSRILDAVWRNNKLWVVFTIFPNSGTNQGQATAHWVRCSTQGGAVTFEAQGDLGGEGIAAGTHTYYPSVAVNSRNVVAYGYAASSPSTYGGAYASVGTSEQSYTVKSGLAYYIRDFGGRRNSWGKYSGISVDPTDDSFWVFNEYAETRGSAGLDGQDGRWGTAWARLACTVRNCVAVVPCALLLLKADSHGLYNALQISDCSVDCSGSFAKNCSCSCAENCSGSCTSPCTH
jgi:hypothetical protein